MHSIHRLCIPKEAPFSLPSLFPESLATRPALNYARDGLLASKKIMTDNFSPGDAEFLLLSYPRSGSTWLRYCVEFITERPTLGPAYNMLGFETPSKPVFLQDGALPVVHSHIDSPFFKEYVQNSPILLKRHEWFYEEAKVKHSYKKMILILRNYKEVMIRNDPDLAKRMEAFRFNPNEDDLLDTVFDANSGGYIELIRRYHEHKGYKTIVYYEDLILKPKEALENLIKSMGMLNEQTLARLKELMDKFEFHKNRSAEKYRNMSGHGHQSAYATNTVDNKDMDFHRKGKSIHMMRDFDKVIKERWPELFDLYLKRYQERKPLRR